MTVTITAKTASENADQPIRGYRFFTQTGCSIRGLSRLLELLSMVLQPLGHAHEQGLQSFRHRRVGKHGVSQNCVRLACQHRELNRTHEFACLRPKAREPENAVTVC